MTLGKLTTAALFNLFWAAAVFAQTIDYDVIGYGSRHVVVVLSGSIPVGLTTSMSSDGLSARISAVDVHFVPRQPDKATPSLAPSVQQVKRGLTTDLIVNLTQAVELSAAPGDSDLKLFLKVKRSGGLDKAASTPGPVAAVDTRRTMPIRFVTGKQPGPASSSAGLTIVLPEINDLKPKTAFSADLRWLAYALDMLWSLLNATELEYFDRSGHGASNAQTREQIVELENLVQDLTKELVELRKELADKATSAAGQHKESPIK